MASGRNLHRIPRSNAKRPFSYLSATPLAAAFQAIIETGRAFTEYRHPDVTNILLAALGAAAGIYLYHRALSTQINLDPGYSLDSTIPYALWFD